MGGGQRTVGRDLSLGYLPHDAINLISLVSSWAEGKGRVNTPLHGILQSPLRCTFMKYLFIFDRTDIRRQIKLIENSMASYQAYFSEKNRSKKNGLNI